MRYDTEILFQKLKPGEYNPKTGNYEDDQIISVPIMASIMDTQTQMMIQIYGKLKQGSKTIQIQEHFEKPFDSIRIGNKTYTVDLLRDLRHKQTFYVSEKQGENYGRNRF